MTEVGTSNVTNGKKVAEALKRALLVLTSATALSVAALGLGASGAYAEDNKPNYESGLSCEIKEPNGNTTHYPPGTTITVSYDGKTEKYRCDGNTGKWVLQARLIGITDGPVLTDGAELLEPGTVVGPSKPQFTAVEAGVIELAGVAPVERGSNKAAGEFRSGLSGLSRR